MDKKPTTSQF